MSTRANAKILFSGALAGILLLAPASARDDFRIYGTIYDATEQPAAGYRLIFHDSIANEDREALSNGTGMFAIVVPHSTFRLVSVLGMSGESYEVRPTVTITDGSAGVRVSVRLVRVAILGSTGEQADATVGTGAPGPAIAGLPGQKSSIIAEVTVGTGAAGPAIAQNNKKYGGVPWYKKPGSIVGISLGSVLGAALLVGGSGGDNNASPSMP